MLKKLKMIPLTTNELAASGWLKRQLEVQAKGLSGNLDKIWPDISDSKWIGGDKDGWERVPYWLDGFIPLAYLLDDEDLKKRAKNYIDGIISRQKPDGWICPCEDDEREHYDIWSAFLICKVLVLYADCSGDERIEKVVYDVLHQMLPYIAHCTLFNWSSARWYECLIPIMWLYERCEESWLIDLAFVLEGEGIDYEKLYHSLPFTRPEVKKYWTYLDHVVNVAMAFKARALMSRITGENPDEFAKFMYEKVHKNHGMATGHFTGDECLSGTSPIQGSECCSVAEAMYSYEQLLSISGNPFWGDILERTAYNAFPATTSPDMWTHQYVQLTNQVECSIIPEEAVQFNSNSGEAHIFGLEPNFGCCTANFNQAWPKLALSTIMKSEDGIAITVIAPSIATLSLNGANVRVEQVTDYPFKDTLCVKIETDKAVKFTLSIRIPEFSKNAFVDGVPVKTGEFYHITREWNGKESVQVEFKFETKLQVRPNDMVAVERGALVFSVPIKEQWNKLEFTRNGVERRFPYCDYEIKPLSDWNYAFASDEFEIVYNDVADMPFSQTKPAIQLKAKMVHIPWSSAHGVCAEIPDSRMPIGDVQDVLLQPYGATSLRMTEMPFVKKVGV